MEKPIEELWNNDNNKYLTSYRDLEWVSEPCKSCPVLEQCSGGCKIDNTCNSEHIAHIDYYLRYMDLKPDYDEMKAVNEHLNQIRSSASNKPLLKTDGLIPNRPMKIVQRGPEEYYLVNPDVGVVKISKGVKELIESVMHNPTQINNVSASSLGLLIEMSVLVPEHQKIKI